VERLAGTPDVIDAMIDVQRACESGPATYPEGS
jgi:hypothetical protein